ncbi:MAG: hypothetical protein HZB71_15090 [Betaproteobacteria bacterium]|nr:hypothetical protein [Betaproteobacteria bacterium]
MVYLRPVFLSHLSYQTAAVNLPPLLRKLLPFLLAFVLPLVLSYAWWGGFNAVVIEPASGGPYTYAYLEQKGDYAKLPDLAGEVHAALLAQKIEPGLPINVLYSNPEVVDVGERVARTGYLIPEGVAVKHSLAVDRIPARQVLRARLQASPLLAPSRVYLALDRHQQARGRGIRMPTVEIYRPTGSVWRMGELTVEMDAP